MNPGATSERVYDELKRRIVEREFRPGDRLDPSVLSETLFSSVTPVRDCLLTLKGEGLVETRASEGFHLPHVDTPALQDLYAWNAQILALALKDWEDFLPRQARGRMTSPSPGEIVLGTAEVFAGIASRSPNVEHRRATGSVNDRLHAARMAETKVLADLPAELRAIDDKLASADRAALQKLIRDYHRRRHHAAAEIVRTLYRNGVPR